jgi:hypothetical protein
MQCLHGPSKIATEKYRMQSQSHELFALGLSTASPTANEDEHKQVMEEKIAAFDDKLVKAQKDPARQNHEASNGGSVKATVVVTMSPPEMTLPKGPSSQQQNCRAEVHHAQARQTIPIPFQQGMGMGMFRLNDSRKPKPGRKGPQNKDNSKVTTNTTLGMKNVDVRKASASPQPIVCQQRSIGSVLSPTAVKQRYSENLPTRRPTPQGSVVGHSPATTKNVRPGCKAFQQAFQSPLEAPRALSPQHKPERRPPRRSPSNSDHDSHTMATDESMLSQGRSPSPLSEPASSKPPPFVHLSDLERLKSHDRAVPEAQITIFSERLAHEQIHAVAYIDMDVDDSDGLPSSFEDYLNADWDHTTAVSKSTDTDFVTSQSGNMSLDGNTSKAALLEPKWVDIADAMEIDA